MDVAKYTKIKESPHGEYSLEEYTEADKFAKNETMKELNRKLEDLHVPAVISMFVSEMCKSYFGTGEIDQFLIELEVYPEWV